MKKKILMSAAMLTCRKPRFLTEVLKINRLILPFMLIGAFPLLCIAQQSQIPPHAFSATSESSSIEFATILKKARDGDAVAQFEIARYLSDQLKMPIEESALKEVISWYTLSANQGHADSQGYLGTFYLSGLGVEKDFEQAEKLLGQSAKGGSLIGTHNLATMHMQGLTHSPSRKTANRLFKEAAERGYVDSMYSLGLMANESENIEEAYGWYEKAASLGHAESENNLAVYLLTGNKYVVQDLERAFRLFQASAQKGFSLAQCSLGDMYMQGTGCTSDLKQACYWYRKASEQGDGIAAYKLGINSALGIGMEVDELGAARLFLLAKKNGVNLMAERDELRKGILNGTYDRGVKNAIRIIEITEKLTPPLRISNS